MKRRCFNSLHPTPNDTKLRFYMLQSTLLCTGYCSLVTFREVFFVNKVHRKPENCGAKSCECMISVHREARYCERSEQ